MHHPRMPKGPLCMRDSLPLWFVTSHASPTLVKKGSLALFLGAHISWMSPSITCPLNFPSPAHHNHRFIGILPRELVSGECVFGLNPVLLAPCVRLGMQQKIGTLTTKEFKSPREKEKKWQKRAEMKRCSSHPPTYGRRWRLRSAFPSNLPLLHV